MQRKSISIFILLSLIGLAIVQFRLLFVGMKFEKTRFDERVRIALNESKLYLENQNDLADSLVLLMPFFPDSLINSEPSKVEFVTENLTKLIHENLLEKGINANFSFAITDRSARTVHLKSPKFEEGSFIFDYYGVTLGNRISARCHCERVIHLDIHNIFGVLLGNLDFLVIPSVLFILTLIGSFWFLIKTLQKEEKLNATKNEFINNLTHELKTPVFSISLSSKILKEKLEKGEIGKAKQFVQLIDNENERMKIHVEKVLELASLESGNYNLNIEKSDVHELIKTVTKDFKIRVQNNNGQFFEKLNAENSNLKVDQIHFKNVIQNLLENALKYSPNNIEILIETKSGNGKFLIEIKDKGIGIAKEFQDKIFQKFYRVPSGNLHEVKGFGLGLNYVQRIVEAHEGKIYLDSQKGKGSIFKIEIPYS